MCPPGCYAVKLSIHPTQDGYLLEDSEEYKGMSGACTIKGGSEVLGSDTQNALEQFMWL